MTLEGHFGYLFRLCEKNVPHETIAPADEIEVRAPGKVTEKSVKLKKTWYENSVGKPHRFSKYFCLML